VLELAAVEGKSFHAATVSALVPDGLGDVDDLLAALVRRELVRPEGGADRVYLFRHQLVRDAAYESIPKQTRVELHERLVELGAEPIAYHREQASRYRAELGLEAV